jgi:hypothetical protein
VKKNIILRFLGTIVNLINIIFDMVGSTLALMFWILMFVFLISGEPLFLQRLGIFVALLTLILFCLICAYINWRNIKRIRLQILIDEIKHSISAHF